VQTFIGIDQSPLLAPLIGIVGLAWFIPIIAAAIGAASSYFQNRGSHNQGAQHPNVDPGVPGIGPQGGLIFEQGSPYWPGSQPTFPSNLNAPQGGGGGGGGGSTSSSYNKSVTDQTYENTVSPFITPEYSKLGKLLNQQTTARLASPTSLPRGYQAGGLQSINDAFDLTGQSLENRLVGSGQQGPMAGGAYAGFEGERAKALSGFTNELPMKERAVRTEDMQLAAAILDAFGKGQKTTGKSHSVTTSQGVNSVSGGGGGGGAPAAAPLVGDAILQQYLNRPQSGAGGSWWEKSLGYLGLIAGIYSQLRGNGGGSAGGPGVSYVNRQVGG
jgi:hypothetical protein